jgi:hypothetical protein
MELNDLFGQDGLVYDQAMLAPTATASSACDADVTPIAR